MSSTRKVRNLPARKLEIKRQIVTNPSKGLNNLGFLTLLMIKNGLTYKTLSLDENGGL